jgi:ribosomal protein S27AE
MAITNQLGDEYLNKIKKALEKSGALKKPCPRCGGVSFGIIDDIYTLEDQKTTFYSMNILNKSIPYISVFCAKCGFLSFHSTAILESSLNKE